MPFRQLHIFSNLLVRSSQRSVNLSSVWSSTTREAATLKTNNLSIPESVDLRGFNFLEPGLPTQKSISLKLGLPNSSKYKQRCDFARVCLY